MKSEMSNAKSRVTPGINPQVTVTHFTEEERKIIHRISLDWYVTNSGSELSLGPTSVYRYLLIKPIDIFREMFNLEREMVVIFSPYEKFEPRTLDAITVAANRHQKLRIERICAVVVSRDEEIEGKLGELLKNDQEAQIVVPFTYGELLQKPGDDFFFRNRFKKHFYSRDLFASEAPLKKDLYFFGRTDLVHSIVNRHRSNQVSGLFGLRKTGKTSVIFGIQRALERVDGKSAFIDCQNPAFHRARWNTALYYVLNEIKSQNRVEIRLGNPESYNEENAPLLFEKHITRMSNDLGQKNILLIFDEVENITPNVSPSDHWREGRDFVFFWQTLRSLFQKLEKVFSYLIVGTNPLCVEIARVANADNPIYGQIPLEYIPRFDVPQTREMVRRLGRIMGLRFDEILYGKLTEDFGGHPYLIRHLCSVINNLSPIDRPVKVDKATYEKAKKIFMRDYGHFLDMILNVLKDFFNDEYEMLLLIARGDNKAFKELSAMSPLFTNHLLGYGILEENEGNFYFRIESILDNLKSKEKFKSTEISQKEMWAEVSERRNDLEQKLRKLCRMQLKSHLGEMDTRSSVLDLMGEPRNRKNAGLSYADLFDANKSGMRFLDLCKITRKHWDCFKHILGPDKDDVLTKMELINNLRVDAHAKEITQDEFQMFRLCIKKLEKLVSEFLS